MSALLLALLLTQAPDAPVKSDEVVVVVNAGDVAPFEGVLLTTNQSTAAANRIRAAEHDRDSRVSLGVVVLTAALCLAGGTALGFAIAKATAGK